MLDSKHLASLLLSVIVLAPGCSKQGSDSVESAPQLATPIKLGRTWRLISMGDVNKPTMALPNTPITLTFVTDDRRISGSAGCNNYMGSYTTSGSTLSLSKIGSTRKLCSEPEIQAQETNYLASLQEAEHYQIVDGQLFIECNNGKNQLRFSRTPTD